MQTQSTVVYHSGDFDGLFCREIARHFIKDELVSFIGWDYKDPKLEFPKEGKVYVLDLNPECFKEFPGIDVAKERVVWIDHHKTAIEKWGSYLPGYRIDGVAACRLAWQWFSITLSQPIFGHLPDKESFIRREIFEPLAVRLAGEYDIWDHRGDGDLEFQLGLRAEDPEPEWYKFWDNDSEIYVNHLIRNGKIIQTYVRGQSAIKMQDAFILPWRGLRFLAINDASKGSQAFESRDLPETGHDALMRFYWTGSAWEFSLYHAKHRTDLDLTGIAKAYGGGGHAGACGFRVGQIPFPLYPK